MSAHTTLTQRIIDEVMTAEADVRDARDRMKARGYTFCAGNHHLIQQHLPHLLEEDYTVAERGFAVKGFYAPVWAHWAVTLVVESDVNDTTDWENPREAVNASSRYYTFKRTTEMKRVALLKWLAENPDEQAYVVALYVLDNGFKKVKTYLRGIAHTLRTPVQGPERNLPLV